ncbi:hypothetical protein ACIBBD_00475 [Streptomyces sp. NPDC051315]|uniref:hypothetical protein n=1 Tax=Streptomyces sp. NPDC051315 TaxID=3365650 RepID=UPI00379275FC
MPATLTAATDSDVVSPVDQTPRLPAEGSSEASTGADAIVPSGRRGAVGARAQG